MYVPWICILSVPEYNWSDHSLHAVTVVSVNNTQKNERIYVTQCMSLNSTVWHKYQAVCFWMWLLYTSYTQIQHRHPLDQQLAVSVVLPSASRDIPLHLMTMEPMDYRYHCHIAALLHYTHHTISHCQVSYHPQSR